MPRWQLLQPRPKERRQGCTTPKLPFSQMMKRGEKLVFAPCRGRSYATFEDVSNGEQVIKALSLVGLDSGRKLCLEVLGILEGCLLKASEINMALSVAGWARSTSRERRATNPVVLGGKSGQRGGDAETHWKADVSTSYATFKNEAGVAQFEVSMDNQKLAVRFEHKQCRDTMADAVHGWTATVNVNGQVLKGCAWPWQR